MHRGLDVQANSDIVSGYRFCATIQLRTPLRLLRRHGEIHQGIDSLPPKIADELWEGIWIPMGVTFRDLGLDMQEPAFTMASDIGPIPMDGGDYLMFLIATRDAAEASTGIEQRRIEVSKILADPIWAGFVRALGGANAILTQFFPSFVSTVPRMPSKTATELTAAGYESPDAINCASNENLKAIKGVGPALLIAMRQSASNSPDPSARYADRVIR